MYKLYMVYPYVSQYWHVDLLKKKIVVIVY